MNVEKKLEVGDFITVLQWTDRNDNSYRGDCMEVQVIDLPLLRVKRHSGFRGGISSLDNITLNLDQVDIKILTQAFVDNVKGIPKELTPKLSPLQRIVENVEKHLQLVIDNTQSGGQNAMYYWHILHFIAHNADSDYYYLEDKWRAKALKAKNQGR